MQILALDMMKIPAGVAQSVERQFCKLDVGGSIPSTGSILPLLKV